MSLRWWWWLGGVVVAAAAAAPVFLDAVAQSLATFETQVADARALGAAWPVNVDAVAAFAAELYAVGGRSGYWKLSQLKGAAVNATTLIRRLEGWSEYASPSACVVWPNAPGFRGGALADLAAARVDGVGPLGLVFALEAAGAPSAALHAAGRWLADSMPAGAIRALAGDLVIQSRVAVRVAEGSGASSTVPCQRGSQIITRGGEEPGPLELSERRSTRRRTALEARPKARATSRSRSSTASPGSA